MTGRALLNPQAAGYLVKLLGYLGSDHDGEVAAAGRKADQFVRRLGLNWADVIFCPPESWWDMARGCARQAHRLNERERDFIRNIARLRRPPTGKQLAWLQSIYEHLHGLEVA
jgi:hypothetical protein